MKIYDAVFWCPFSLLAGRPYSNLAPTSWALTYKHARTQPDFVYTTQQHLTFLWASAAKPDFVARLLAIAVLSTTNTTRPSKQQRIPLTARSHWCQLTKPRLPPSTFKVLSFPFKVTWSSWRSLIGREWCHADVATTTNGWNVYGKVS
jgi:hypothetical protein